MADGITSFTAFSKSLIVTISLFKTSGASFSSSKLSSGSNLRKHFMAASYTGILDLHLRIHESRLLLYLDQHLYPVAYYECEFVISQAFLACQELLSLFLCQIYLAALKQDLLRLVCL